MQDRCGAKTRSGKPCKTYAMDNGRCRMHGGTNPGAPIIHGRYSIKHKESLREKMQEFLEDPNPGNLIAELALQRTMLQEFIDRLGEDITINLVMRKHVFEMIESISRVVERISRMLNQAALTQADINYLQAVLTDLLIRYIDDPEKRFAFMAELRRAMGSDASTNRRVTQDQITTSNK